MRGESEGGAQKYHGQSRYRNQGDLLMSKPAQNQKCSGPEDKHVGDGKNREESEQGPGRGRKICQFLCQCEGAEDGLESSTEALRRPGASYGDRRCHRNQVLQEAGRAVPALKRRKRGIEGKVLDSALSLFLSHNQRNP